MRLPLQCLVADRDDDRDSSFRVASARCDGPHRPRRRSCAEAGAGGRAEAGAVPCGRTSCASTTPLVEQIEVVTEFRRYVLNAEEQLRLGNWLFAHSVRDAREKLRPWRERVSLVARLRFHPHNTLIGIPPYDIAIGRPDLAPVNVIRTPINALAVRPAWRFQRAARSARRSRRSSTRGRSVRRPGR